MERLGSVRYSAVNLGPTGWVVPTGRVVTKISTFYVTTHPVHSESGSQSCRAPTPTPQLSDQLVTTHPGRVLLKGEILGSILTNNLIMESEKTHNGGVGVSALQGCEPDSE